MQTIQVMKCYLLEGTEVKSVKLQKLKPTNKQTHFSPFLITPLLCKFSYIHRLQPGPTSCQCPSFLCYPHRKDENILFFPLCFLTLEINLYFFKSHTASKNIRTAWVEGDLEESSNSKFHEKRSLDEVI